jgi:hypothetical protein
MKIRFGIGPIGATIRATSRLASNRGGGQDCPDDPTSIWSLRWFGGTGIPRTENPVDHSLRRGTACCARCNAAGQRPSLPAARSTPAVVSCLRYLPQPAGQQTAPATNQPSITVQVPDISNRNWLKNRSCRKQKTKPCLTGARTAQCDALFSRDFRANFAPVEPDRDRPPFARRTTRS